MMVGAGRPASSEWKQSRHGGPYSQDLRDRVIEATGNGMSARQAAVSFDVGVSTAIKWVERLRDSGERWHAGAGRRPARIPDDRLGMDAS